MHPVSTSSSTPTPGVTVPSREPSTSPTSETIRSSADRLPDFCSEESLLRRVSSAARGFAEAVIATSDYGRISDTQFGLTFPINPELLAYAIDASKGEIAVELAGANGENSALLVAGGAQKVYMNDILQPEVDSCSALKKRLPPPIRDRLEPVQADAISFMRSHPELTGKVGLVFCRNLMHFFSDTKQTEVLTGVQEMLKPGGQVIFTVNAVDRIPDVDPTCTSFKITTCICHRSDLTSQGTILYTQASPCDGSEISTQFQEWKLYERDRATRKWIFDNKAFTSLPDAVRGNVKKAVEEKKAELKNPNSTAVRVVMSPIRGYTPSTAADLLERHGFEVLDVTYIGKDHHIKRPLELALGNRTHVAVLARKKSE